MLCLNYLNKTVELLFILYNFAIVPSVGTGIKAECFIKQQTQNIIVPSVGTGIKAYIPVEDLLAAIIVPSVGTGIKTYHL